MIRRKLVTRRNRRKLDPSMLAPASNVTATPSIATGAVQLDFNAPVSLSGIPQYSVQGVLPTGAVANSATRVTLSYATPVVATNVLVIPTNDASIRTSTGGFVNALTHTF